MKKRLAYYLKNPERISEVDKSELDLLVKQHPYSYSLQWLKARFELDNQGNSAPDSIRSAATRTNDLVFLKYQLLRQQEELDKFSTAIGDNLKEDKTAIAPSKVKGDVEKENTGSDKKSTDTASPPETQDQKAQPVTKHGETQDMADEQQDSQKTESQSGKKEEIVNKAIQSMSDDMSDFSRWLLAKGTAPQGRSESKQEASLKDDDGGKDKSSKKKSKKKNKKKKNKLQKLIEHSIIEPEEVVTETYAELVAKQGHTAKAIELYEKLKLKIPEKSTYFAGKIEELKNS